MPSRASALARLTLPRLHAVTQRERLFALIKNLSRQHPLLWVAGPPGAGKTALIASYLTATKQRTLWYHLDPGDADLATFFHYLAESAQGAAGRKRLRLPALTPEFLADVPDFTRRFMRELWAKIPRPAVVVLDNYQDLPVEAALHRLLSVALAEFPPGATLMVLSRDEASPHVGQELAHGVIGRLTWEHLRLTFEETQRLASSLPSLDQETLRTLYARSNGWVAGTVLMLERVRANKAWDAPLPSDTMVDVFHYFANQVFEHMAVAARDVLMRTSLLPWMTGAMAEEVSGQAGAGHVIRDLYQRGLFVDRRAETHVAYQYHDLFREFLLSQCHAQVQGAELQDLKRTAAGVAEQAGQQDTAVALYAETRSWDALSGLIGESAERLLSQGRYQTLQGYIALLPEAERHARPWLLYWSGMSRLVFDPPAARADLETAYHQFDQTGQDLTGLLLAASGMIEAYYCAIDDMAPTIPWGDRLHRLIQKRNGFPSPAVEAKVLTNLQGLMYACPHHPLLLELEQSIDRILHSLDDPAGRLGVAAAFLNLPIWRGEFLAAGEIIETLNVDIREREIPPLPLLIWRLMESTYAWNTGARVRAKEILQEAFSIAETFGIHVFKPYVWGVQTYNALAAGDTEEGDRLADLLQTTMQNHQGLAVGQHHFYRAGIALMRGELPTARQHAVQSVNVTVRLCIPFLAGNCRVGLAKVLIELGEKNEAQDQLTVAFENARLIGSRTTEVHCLLTMAQFFLKDGQLAKSNAALKEGLQLARDLDYLTLDYWWRPRAMAALLAQALEAGIEVEYVRSVIRRRGLRAPSSGIHDWPYPLTITTLGRFEVAIDNVPLTYTGKAQRKPLDLLKYLCAANAQRIHQDLIEEALWPDADGEAAEQVFRTTLHRLRKLLQYDDAVQLSDRQVSLDPSLVSLDHVAFDEQAKHVDRTDATSIARALTLYRGHFLQGETAPWVLPVRERLRARFLDLTDQLGILLETQGDVAGAAQMYLRALEVEPVAEVMCRRVMMAYVKVGRRTEAIAVYQRFTQALHKKLGISPTPETLALYHNIINT